MKGMGGACANTPLGASPSGPTQDTNGADLQSGFYRFSVSKSLAPTRTKPPRREGL
jgi:hypothetical protein